MKKNFIFSLIFLFSIVACKKEEFAVQPTDLYGIWERYYDDNSNYQGMQIEISGNLGIVSANNSTSNTFPINTTKWRNIFPIRDSIFNYDDLGSDGRFYRGQMRYKIINDTTFLHCIILNGSPGLGKNQTWIKL